MKFNFENLDQTIRQLMINEMNFDIQNNKLYLSKRFNNNGQEKFKDLLKQSLESGDEQTLAVSLKNNNCFKSQEERKTKTGTSLVKVL
ncbi:hypothetical protein [Chryseobacterium indoltheticum]|uniref:hypothetical protein n=1 Tax=Chryseobacterium indoltheticum TaxID=254 RepID=UPI003F496A6D